MGTRMTDSAVRLGLVFSVSAMLGLACEGGDLATNSGAGEQAIVDQTSAATAASGPCDIYAAAGTPCVAAYSMVRTLSKAYTGPLYQVRRGAGLPNTGTGGTTQDIGAKGGFADAAAQDAFGGTSTCTVSKL